MDVEIHIKMNEKLFVRNPEQTDLGKKIIKNSIELIQGGGFEAFTFKKLAEHIGTTEAGIYRYFENKHRLLIYITAWYWSYLQYRVVFETNNIDDPAAKLKKVIQLLTSTVLEDERVKHIDEKLLHEIIIAEGSKAYLTKHISEDNRDKLFKPYKDLCSVIAEFITASNPAYKFPHSLASTIIEAAHNQNFFMHHLPSLTDFATEKSEKNIALFIEEMVFNTIGSGH
ncbi:TetR/AcrR family transcriptional regulator [Segetibacter sp.]|jgi:AcrR family transcriptional regulator|uniref:TetR/AcrR family transcriptional regulator n=1 Tax=Segetibacter sp. TaxID=2231182 RepID=UPI0026070C90|nr:TetR/AcrR family transcriptional regulator [Segetibacter sp.]MCW3080270.1 TetR family transcriptional regulator [Segetibacter sp.]